jgi:hypothetical protein
MTTKTLTAERLRELLSYDPETGVFTRRTAVRGRNVGERAGTLTRGYRQLRVGGRTSLEHELAWLYVNGEWPTAPIEHLNGDRSDNRIENLSLAKPYAGRDALTAERLREQLDYDPETGVFVWKVANSMRVKVGQHAGHIAESGYRLIHCFGRIWRAHHLAWLHVYGKLPDKEVDHRDGNRANNAILNLRLATRTQNSWNCGLQRNNTTGLKGIYLARKVGLYRARIKVEGKTIDLGYHGTKEEAHAAYCAAALKYHGEFARVS